MAGSIPAKGINRNIVECKEYFCFCVCGSGCGINRNIVECKVEYLLADQKESAVLIETLWNVKDNVSRAFLAASVY